MVGFSRSPLLILVYLTPHAPDVLLFTSIWQILQVFITVTKVTRVPARLLVELNGNVELYLTVLNCCWLPSLCNNVIVRCGSFRSKCATLKKRNPECAVVDMLIILHDLWSQLVLRSDVYFKGYRYFIMHVAPTVGHYSCFFTVGQDVTIPYHAWFGTIINRWLTALR